MVHLCHFSLETLKLVGAGAAGKANLSWNKTFHVCVVWSTRGGISVKGVLLSVLGPKTRFLG